MCHRTGVYLPEAWKAPHCSTAATPVLHLRFSRWNIFLKGLCRQSLGSRRFCLSKVIGGDRDVPSFYSQTQIPIVIWPKGWKGSASTAHVRELQGGTAVPFWKTYLCLQNYLIPESIKFSAFCREEASTRNQTYHEIYAENDRYPELKAIRKEPQTPLGRRHCHLVSG